MVRRKRIKSVLAEKEPQHSKWMDLTDLMRQDHDSGQAVNIDDTENEKSPDKTIDRDAYGEPKLNLNLDSTGTTDNAQRVAKNPVERSE